LTFRARLVLLNTAALAGLLGTFAGGLAWLNQNRLRSELVGDLERRGEEAARGPGNRGPAPRPPSPPPGASGPDPYAEARRLTDVRRPRFFDARGQGDVALDPVSLSQALRGRRILAETTGLLTYSVPLPGGGVAQVARETTDIDRLEGVQRRALGLLLPLGMAIAALSAWLLARHTLRPVREIARAADALGASDLSRRLPVEGDDELGELARTLNAMLARLQRSFEEQRRFVADASHELRTPLSRLRLAASAARDRHPDDGGLAAIEGSAAGLAQLAESLLTLARADATGLGLRLEPVDLRVVVAEALDDAPVVAEFPDAPVPTLVDAAHLGRAIRNLVENARRHTPAPGRIFVSVTPSAGIVVRDEGTGIAAESLPRVFDRFYRADESRSGTGAGLGLAIVKEIVEAHGGRAEIESELGHGTAVRLLLPKSAL